MSRRAFGRSAAMLGTVAVIASVLAPAAAASAADSEDEDAPTAPAVTVSVIVPLSLPISSGASLSADTLATATAPGGVLDAELSDTIDTPVTYAIDPMLIASIRGLGTNAPESARVWLERLASAHNPSFPLAWADSDVTAPLQAGRDAPLRTGSLGFLVDTSGFASDEDSTAAPSPDGPQPVPTDDELVAWDYTLPSAVWPVADSTTGDDLTALGERSFSPTLLNSGNVKRSDELTASVAIAGGSVLVTDDAASALLDTALATADDAVREQAIDALASSVATRSAAAPASSQRSLVLALDRTTEPDTSRLRSTLVELGMTGAVTFAGLDALLVDDAPTARVVDEPQSKSRIARVTSMLQADRGDARFSSVADDPAALAGRRRAELLVALGPGADDPPGGWYYTAQNYLDASDALRAGVSLAPTSPISLLADRASIPVTVQNDLDVPVTVYVTIRPFLPLIDVEDDAVELHIEPGSQARADVPVRSIANGTVELGITLHTSTDVQVGDSRYVRTSVQAGWEGPVTVIGGVLVVAVFALGLVRGIVRRRRAARTAASEAAADTDAGPDVATEAPTAASASPGADTENR